MHTEMPVTTPLEPSHLCCTQFGITILALTLERPIWMLKNHFISTPSLCLTALLLMNPGTVIPTLNNLGDWQFLFHNLLSVD